MSGCPIEAIYSLSVAANAPMQDLVHINLGSVELVQLLVLRLLHEHRHARAGHLVVIHRGSFAL